MGSQYVIPPGWSPVPTPSYVKSLRRPSIGDRYSLRSDPKLCCTPIILYVLSRPVNHCNYLVPLVGTTWKDEVTNLDKLSPKYNERWFFNTFLCVSRYL